MADAIERKIAELVRAAGGKTYYVGGFVRDKLLGIGSKDIDIEVHGLEPQKLKSILEEIGTPLSLGSSFGIYSLKGSNIDIAMPRIENATGSGHRDFDVFIDPFIGETEAARRRDFTMNAVMEDVLSGDIVDSFGGIEDIKNGIIRHVDSASFAEDPLRVLRAAQFASRFGFTIADETKELCKSIDISTLSKERVEEELKKALLKGGKPSVFFETLREMDQLECWFPELKSLIGLRQDPVFHPEGDVWTHSLEVLDRGAAFRDEVSDAYSFMLLCLLHDLGKIVCTEEKDGRIHAYGHETSGLPIIETFLERIVSEKRVRSYVLNMSELHMKPNIAAFAKPSEKSTNHMFDDAASPKDLIYFAMSDKPVMSGDTPFTGDSNFLFERLEAYEKTMAKPYVQGRDLTAAGLKPGTYFAELLDLAHKLRLAGVDKETALKQVLGTAKTMKKMD